MESLKEYKTKRLMRELKKYKTLYEEFFEENYKQKLLLNSMAKDNANLKKRIIEIEYYQEIEKLKEDIETQKKIKKDIE